MSDEQSNQPRKVKDLKARLGRTIAPSTPGAVMPPGINLPSPVAGVPTPPGAAPAAAADGGAGAAPPVPGAVPVPPPPGGIPAPALPPPAAGLGVGLGAPLPGPKAVVEPPWVKQQREEEEKRRVEDEKRKKRAAADPFATAEAPVGPQAVRIILDDSAVADNETGKKGRNLATVGVVVVVALIAMFIGKSIGASFARNASINQGIASAEALHTTVQRGDTALQAMKVQVDKLVAAAQTANGNTPHVDFAAVEAAVGVTNPFTAEHFATTNYTLFDAAAIDAMLKYYDSTRQLFERIERLARSYNISGRNQQGRDQLNASFQAYDNFQKYPVACVPTLVGEGPAARWACNMVFVDVEHATAEGIPSRTRPSAQPTMRALFSGQPIAAALSDKLLIQVNMQASTDVMGSTLELHNRFVRDLGEIKALLDGAMEARANFRNEMDRIRHLPQQFTF